MVGSVDARWSSTTHYSSMPFSRLLVCRKSALGVLRVHVFLHIERSSRRAGSGRILAAVLTVVTAAKCVLPVFNPRLLQLPIRKFETSALTAAQPKIDRVWKI